MLLDTLSIFVKNMLKKVFYIFSIGGLLANIYATSLTEQVSCIHDKMLRLHDSLDSKTLLKKELGESYQELGISISNTQTVLKKYLKKIIDDLEKFDENIYYASHGSSYDSIGHREDLRTILKESIGHVIRKDNYKAMAIEILTNYISSN